MVAGGSEVVSRAREVKSGHSGPSNILNKALETGSLTDRNIITERELYCSQVQKQVEAEVATLEGEVTDVACEQLPILNAVIEESLRLYGTAPGCMPRSPPSGAAMVGGYFIPDDAVVTQYWSLQRNPVICENTDIFDHTRWLRGSGMTEPAKLTFNPFGYGARQCLGIHLGRMTMRLAAAMFFRECRGSRLARSVTESMRIVDSFIVGVPRDRRYSITLQ